jgi:DNA-binding PadR family transcriptional regulator
VWVDDLTELLKGVLEGCVLQILARGGSYGYEIVRSLNSVGFTSVSEGTVYPILVRLEKKSLVTVAKVHSEAGPPRKVYTLNTAGHEALQAFWRRWEFISARVTDLKSDPEGESDA